MPKSQSQNREVAPTQRLDKWLWYARVVKTRTLAAGLVQSGKVRVNRDKTDKPGHAVKIDDVVTVNVRGRIKVLKVKAAGVRRGPAAEAAELYEDLTPPPVAGPAAALPGGQGQPGPAAGGGGQRPTKRDRRALERLRDNQNE